MTKDKPCKVCLILNSDSNFSDYINSRLKNDVKIAEIRKEFTNNKYLAPSDYYLKDHKVNCLKDFKVEVFDSSLPSTLIPVIKNKEINLNDLDIVEELERYRNMSFQEKEEDDIVRLKEIKYMTSIKIHHQLLYGRINHKTASVPKEDIGALKQVEDILQVLTSDTFDKDEIPEFNINIKNTSEQNSKILSQYDFNHFNVIDEKVEDDSDQ